MAIATQTNALNLQPGVFAPVVVHCSQGDSGRTITFYLYNGSEKYTPSGVSISVHGTRRDGGNFGPFACTYSGNAVSFNLRSSMTAVEGGAVAELTIVDSYGNTSGSANFAILVEKATWTGGVTYSNDVSVYQNILKYIQVIDARVNTIISQAGKDNTEIIDIRTGANGTVYASAGEAVRKQINSLENAFNYLIISNDNNDVPFFEVTGIETTANHFTYTIRCIWRESGWNLYGFDDRNRLPIVHIFYKKGCGNVGESATEYCYDDKIVSDAGIIGFALFVADQTDFMLKIISINDYRQGQLVIGAFYGKSLYINTTLTGFGFNDGIFSNPRKTDEFKKFRIANTNVSAFGALTWTIDSDGYVVVKKNKNFNVYGYFDGYDSVIAVSGESGDFVFPDEIKSKQKANTFMAICFALQPSLTDDKIIIISIKYLPSYATNYALLGIMFNENRGFFYSSGAEYLFTNFVRNNLNDKSVSTSIMAKFWNSVPDTIFPYNGKVVFDPDNTTLTISGTILGPDYNPGFFDITMMSKKVVLDFSNDKNPTFAKCIYWRRDTHTFVYYSSDAEDTAADDGNNEAWKKIANKVVLCLFCIVWNNRYIYTSNTIKGVWYVKGKDIYATDAASGSRYESDLYKAFQKVGVVGDSLSVGYMYNKNTGVATSRMLEYSWPKVVMRDAGKPWLNFGTSGQNVLTWCTNGTYGKVQVEASGNKCQAYIIGLGENDCSDSNRGIPLGTPSDIKSDYTVVATTYYGGYVRIIEILKHLNPSCKIFCLTNPRSGTARANYNVAVRYICNTYYANDANVILVDTANLEYDLFNGGEFLPLDSATIQGGHYSPIGYARIASIMEYLISQRMQDSYVSIWDIAYIPYDTSDPTDSTMTK